MDAWALDSRGGRFILASMIYVCAGMYRSGSTWLYNAVRLILEDAGAPDLAAGWAGEKDRLITRRNVVIKIHAFDEDLAARQIIALTSHRDLRDVAASLARKFKTGFSIATLRETVESHERWSRIAVFDLHYEDLLADKMRELQKVAAALRLPPAVLERLPYESILARIEGEKFTETRSTSGRFDSVNLLHEGHITDGRHGSWEGTLPAGDVNAIEKEFRPWLVAKGYLA